MFRVLKLTQSGLAVLESEDAKPVEGLTLYAEGEKAAVVTDTIASVAKPLYLAKPLKALSEGMVLVAGAEAVLGKDENSRFSSGLKKR